MGDARRFVREFLIETREGLDQAGSALAALDATPVDREALSCLRRVVHTLAGSASFLGFRRLEAAAREGDDLLSLLRDGELGMNPAVSAALRRLMGAVRDSLPAIEAGGAEGPSDHSAVIETLRGLRTAVPPARPRGR